MVLFAEIKTVLKADGDGSLSLTPWTSRPNRFLQRVEYKDDRQGVNNCGSPIWIHMAAEVRLCRTPIPDTGTSPSGGVIHDLSPYLLCNK